MCDEFDVEFEDELDALADLDQDFNTFETKSKKSLDFSTPTTSHVRSRLPNLDKSLDATPLALDRSQSPETQPTTKDDSSQTRQSKKRCQDDMYADLSDDSLDNLDLDKIPDIAAPRRKKARTSAPDKPPDDDDDDFEITPPPSPDNSKKLAFLRTSRSLNVGVDRRQHFQDRLEQEYDLDRPRVLKRIPNGDFVSITSEDGRRVYLAAREENDYKKELSELGSGQKCLELLGTSVHTLKMQIQDEKRRQVLAEAERITQVLQNNVDEETALEMIGAATDRRQEEEEEEREGESDSEVALWVERYSPHRYTDLLSDEATNRILLKWLKLWDPLVFGRQKKVKVKDAAAVKKQEAKEQKWGKSAFELTDELDKHNRPMHKVVLVSGPPGLGKTTLAHVIGKHAGYNVVEMNASDDRAVDVFRTKIEAATQMKAVLGADPRPNCLIIDEIDGAPSPAINVLLSMIKAGENIGGGKKKKKDGGLLLRPIICICNDLYVPALRQLKQLALVVYFQPTLSAKLAQRLLEISRQEKLKTDLTTLLALCEKADNDIRSCINTLQFVRGRSAELSLQAVSSMSLGQKDAHKTLFAVWKDIFQMPKPKRKRYVNPYDRTQGQNEPEDVELAINQNNVSLPARFHHSLQMALAAGEPEKVAQGLYENYLEAKVKDPRMEAVLLAGEWLQFIDVVNQDIQRSQNYSLMPYMPYLPVAFHLLFASNAPHKIQYPHAHNEYRMKLSKTEGLLTSLVADVAPSVRKNLNTTTTVLEVLPCMMDIIQPTLRPVNTQLYSSREKEGLNQLIQIMIAYNLTYRQERTPEGQYVYQLDPEVDDMVKFPGQKPHKQLTYAAKQLIAREIELERMRRSEATTGNARLPAASAKRAQSEPSSSSKAQLPNHMRQTLQPKKVEVVEERPLLDFFGRRIVKKTTPDQTKKKEVKKDEIGGDIWFRFKEGFSNAVRKTVRVQDLI